MDSCLILRATLFGMILLGLLTPEQTEAGCGSVKSGYNNRRIKRQLPLGSVKSGYNNQGMKKQAALEGKDHPGGGQKEDVGTLVTQANRQGRTGAKIGPGRFGTERPTTP